MLFVICCFSQLQSHHGSDIAAVAAIVVVVATVVVAAVVVVAVAVVSHINSNKISESATTDKTALTSTV